MSFQLQSFTKMQKKIVKHVIIVLLRLRDIEIHITLIYFFFWTENVILWFNVMLGLFVRGQIWYNVWK